MIKKVINRGLAKFGYRIQKIPQRFEFSMEAALMRCVNRGLNINSVIDVGASDGRWSRICMRYLPNARYLLIEAQEAHEKGLKQLQIENSNVDYILAAAGGKIGKIFFDNSDLFGGVASEIPLSKDFIEVPVIAIDNEIKRLGLLPPFLIKLDTHGFEVPILEGAKDSVKAAELIIMETYNFKLTDRSLKYYQMCNYMESLGFSTIEMVDAMLRKYDSSFWQMDTFFMPSRRREFLYNKYV